MLHRAAVVFAMLFVAATALADRPAGEFSWLNAYPGRTYTLRPSVNGSPHVFLPIVNDLAMLEMQGDMFPLMAPETITVDQVDLDLDRAIITFRFTGGHGDRGRFLFIAPRRSNETMGRNEIEGLLALVTAEGSGAPYVVNADSGTLHFRGSNHARGFTVGGEYDDVAAAQSDGHDLCPACFGPIHLLPDYEKEVALGRRVAAEVRGSFSAVTDDAVQRRVQEAGARVLARWPQPLRGYQYRFTVLQDIGPGSIACPGGWIFVHDGLLELCENDLELEAILAHEIAHVEMRHGLRQLRSAEKAVRAGVMAGVMIGAVAASQGEGAGAAAGAGFAATVAATGAELAIGGYPRDMKLEADAAAMHYMVRSTGEDGRRHLASILTKIEYYESCSAGGVDAYRYDRPHVPNSVRSDFAANAAALFFDEPLSFAFSTADGGHYELDIIGICHHAYFDQEPERVFENQQDFEFGVGGTSVDGVDYGTNRTDTRIFAAVRAGAGVERGMKFKDLDLMMDGGWVKFDNKEDTTLYPNAEVSMVLVRGQKGLFRFASLLPTQVRHSGQATEAKRDAKRQKGGADPLR